MSARSLAFQVLVQVERADAWLSLALDAGIRSAGALSRQDAALATELAYGVSRRALTLDAVIAAHSHVPLRRLETRVHAALRLGAYQLIFLERVPDHAAVSETVQLLRDNGLARAAGFANAVLRKIATERTVPLPEDPLERISVEQSHPSWLVRRWAERWGAEQTEALCRSHNLNPPVCVRVDPARASREEVAAALSAAGVGSRPALLSPVGLLLENAGPLAQLEPFARGLFQVQDEAAQLVGLLAGAAPGMRVLDACAAPGGKSCHLAEQLKGQGELFAVDLHPRKLERLAAEAARLGLSGRIHARTADATRPLPFERASFDLVLLDAPCSGLGTLRRHPELRYRRKPEDIARLAGLQSALAENLLAYLKPGGAFVFAVCSMEPEEGEALAEQLAARGLRVEPPEAAGVPWEQVMTPRGFLATLPHRHGTDGFFAARLVSR